MPPQLHQPPPERAVVDPLTHPDDRAAQELRIDRERSKHFLPEVSAQRLPVPTA